MSKLRRIAGNTIISLLGQVITWASTFALTIAYGRFLGDVKFGELYFAITFVSLIGFPLEFGFNQQLTRDVAQVPERALRYLSSTILIKMMLWPILYGILLALSWFLGYSHEIRVLVGICGITLLSGSIANTFAASHYAFERNIYPAVGLIFEKSLSALIGFIVLRFGGSVEMMALVLLGGSLSSVVWQGINFFRLQGISFTIDLKLMRELTRSSIPFLVYGVLGVIYYRLDTVLLSLQTSTAVVGWYGAGYRLFDTLVFLPNIVIMAVLYPVLAKLSVTSEADLKLAIEKATNFMLLCGLPIAAVLIAAAPNIIGLLYHRPEFLHSIPVLQALAPGLVFLYINTVLSTILMSTHQEKKIMIMAGIALIFNLALNLFLIPRFQHVAAATVTSLTEFLLFCISLGMISRHLLPWRSLLVCLKIIVASLVMAGVILLLHTLSIFLILPMASLAYLAVITVLRTIPRSDLETLYSAVRNRAQRKGAAAAPENQPVVTTEEDITEQAVEMELEALDDAFLLADVDTIPMKAAYGAMHPLTRIVSHSKDEDEEEDEDDTTISLKALYAAMQSMQQDVDEEEDEDVTLTLKRVPERGSRGQKTPDAATHLH